MSSGSIKNRLTAADRAASIISYVVNPLLVPPATTAVLLYLVGANADQSLAAFIFTGFAFCVVPLVDILWMVSRGFATSVDLPERSQRTEPLAWVVLIGLSGLFLYTRSESAIDLVAILAAAYVANVLVVLVINAFWKISVHSIAIGGMLGVTLYLIGPFFGLTAPYEPTLVATLVMLAPLVMWSRVQLRAHTLAQVVAGGLLGFGGHWVAFYFMTRLLFS